MELSDQMDGRLEITVFRDAGNSAVILEHFRIVPVDAAEHDRDAGKQSVTVREQEVQGVVVRCDDGVDFFIPILVLENGCQVR